MVSPAQARSQPVALRHALERLSGLQAIAFDLDGTLYHHGAVRRRVATELLALLSRRPGVGLRTVRVLRAYRAALDDLRRGGTARPDLRGEQARLAAARTGEPPSFVEAVVQEWMTSRPLLHLAPARSPGLLEALGVARSAGLRLGVFSDYEPARKLAALNLENAFDVALGAEDPDVGVLKPHPAGLLALARKMNAEPASVAYIGDREDVDLPAASAAGMLGVLYRPRSRGQAVGWASSALVIPDFHVLASLLNAGG